MPYSRSIDVIGEYGLSANESPSRPAGSPATQPTSFGEAELSMQALIYIGPGKRALETRPRPRIQAATDAIVRVTATTICGTDLHILKGDVPTVESGRILGHEGVGVIEDVGSEVASFKRGDRVIISCVTSCG